MSAENFTIRRSYDEKNQKWYFSIVDTIENTVSTTDARNYWKVLKNRLKKGDNELVTKCNQLKMQANDGKWYLTDVADSDILVEIVKLASPSSVSALRSWLAKIELKNAHFEPKNIPLSQPSFPQVEGTEGTRDAVDIAESENELSVDVRETAGGFVIKAFVAGVNPNNISITLTASTITIYGTRVAPQQATAQYIQQELFWGSFSRNINLPSEVEVDHVQAVETHGLLVITLQKINLSRSRPLKIKSL